MTTYQLGILWGISSINPDGRIVLRHKERYFLEQMKSPYEIYTQIAKGEVQYVLKIKDDEIISELKSHGYTSRNADERFSPQCADRDFLKAWLELHSSVDWQTAYSHNRKVKYKKVRLRIYGNKNFIDGINNLCYDILGLTLKTSQRITDKTYYLSYTSQSEIDRIYNEFCDDTILFNLYWTKLFNHISEYNQKVNA